MTANSTDIQGNTISITLKADVDWEWDSSTEIAAAPELNELVKLKGLFIESIQMCGNSDGDGCIIREKSLTGPAIFRGYVADNNDNPIKYFHGRFVNGIYIDKDDVTSGSDDLLIIITLA